MDIFIYNRCKLNFINSEIKECLIKNAYSGNEIKPIYYNDKNYNIKLLDLILFSNWKFFN